MSTKAFRFDPAAVAHYEVEGWKAYYDRAWLKLLALVAALARAQFRIPLVQSWLAAYYITRASVAWVPKDHDDAAITRSLARFYALARRYAGLTFDVEAAARLEAQYWDVHRRLVGQADKEAFVDTMTRLHAVVFGLDEAQTRESAVLRVEANNVLDTITGRTSDDPARDWQQCERLLRACYESLAKAMEQRMNTV